MVERLICMPRVLEFKFRIRIPKAGQMLRSIVFATASTSSQVAVLPLRYDAEMGTITHYILWHNTASIMKGLVLFPNHFSN